MNKAKFDDAEVEALIVAGESEEPSTGSGGAKGDTILDYEEGEDEDDDEDYVDEGDDDDCDDDEA